MKPKIDDEFLIKELVSFVTRRDNPEDTYYVGLTDQPSAFVASHDIPKQSDAKTLK